MAEIESKESAGVAGESVPRADWQKVVDYVQHNPRQVIAGIVFVLLCVAAGGIYSLYNIASDRAVMTQYAGASPWKTPPNAPEPSSIAQAGSCRSTEALYLAAEASSKQRPTTRPRSLHPYPRQTPASEFAAPAAEALAFSTKTRASSKKPSLTTLRYTKPMATPSSRATTLNIARHSTRQPHRSQNFYEKQAEVFPDPLSPPRPTAHRPASRRSPRTFPNPSKPGSTPRYRNHPAPPSR